MKGLCAPLHRLKTPPQPGSQWPATIASPASGIVEDPDPPRASGSPPTPPATAGWTKLENRNSETSGTEEALAFRLAALARDQHPGRVLTLGWVPSSVVQPPGRLATTYQPAAETCRRGAQLEGSQTTSNRKAVRRPTGRQLARIALALLALLSIGAADSPADRKLLAEINSIRRAFPGDMAVYMKNLATGEEIALDADRVYETYSVIKIPVMVEVLRRVERGDFSLTDRIELKSADRRRGSGLLARLDFGLRPTVKDLLTLMIVISDNTATDLLADKVGRDNVTRTMHELGLKRTSIEFSVLDDYRAWFAYMDPAQRLSTPEEVFDFSLRKFAREQIDEASRKLNDDPRIYFGHSTAREIGWLFERMVQGKLVSSQSSALMLEILKQQQVDDRFPRYLPDVTMAHKTGDGQPFIANDAGVMWIKDQPIVLVVFTAHHRGTTGTLHDAIARVAAYTARRYGGDVSPDFRP
jgi:beta-lactamase class A